MTRVFLRILVALAAVVATAATAQSPKWPITVNRSPSGIRFIHILQPDEKSETLYFAFKDGTAVSGNGNSALVAIGSALLGEGTASVEAGELEENLKDLQAGYSFSGRTHYLVGGASAPVANFAAMAEFLKDAILRPRFTDANIKRIRQRASDGVKRGLENPDRIASRLFRTMHIPDSAYLSHVAGYDLAAIDAVGKPEIEAWHKAVIAREHLRIVIGGPMTVEQTGIEIDRIFSTLPEKSQVPARRNANVTAPARMIVLERDVKQSIIIAGGPTNRAGGNIAIARSIGVGVLSEGSGTSRLFLALREKLGATYGASASTASIDGYTSLLQLSTSVSNDKVKESIAALRAEYSRLRTDGITSEELAARVTARKTNVEAGMRRAGAASIILDNMIDGRPFDFFNHYFDNVDKITVEQVNNAITDRLPRDPLSVVVITPSAEGLKADCVIKSEAELAKCLP